jgi:acyl carrier protein
MNLDSIDSLELVVMIEKEWGLGEISSEDMTTMKTVKIIADYIQAHLPEGMEP